MNRKLSLIVPFVFVLVLAAHPAHAGKDTLASVGADQEKVAKKVWFPPAQASMKMLGDIGLPKRVGLLSFYLFDTGSFEHNAMAATYGGTYMKTFGLNEHGANKYASELAKVGVPVLKKQFADHGMELLTPVEFLQNEEQIRAYLDFRLPKSGFQKFAEGALKWLDKNPHASGAADGFEMIPTHLWSDREIFRALDELRTKLGLDGLAVLANTTSSNPKSVIYAGSELQVYGPNPEPLPENKMAAKYWTPLIPYVTGNFGKGFKGVELLLWNKADEVSYAGYDGIIGGLASSTLDELQKYADKGK